MPEDDTVFLAGRRLDDALAGSQLRRGELRHPRLSTVDLAGLAVLDVRSAGKHLFTRFDDGYGGWGVRCFSCTSRPTGCGCPARYSLHTHFRLDGSWHLYRPGERWRGPGHQVRALLATDDRVAVGFRLHDMELLPTAEEDRLVGRLGPDLLDPEWGQGHEDEAVRRLSADPTREIGLALLDQTALAGIGNLYKTEVCFLLGVSPWTPVSEVDTRLAVALCRKLLLGNAWRPEQSTTGELGRGRQHWVYARHTCLRCGTPVQTGIQGSGTRERLAYHCPTCQPRQTL